MVCTCWICVDTYDFLCIILFEGSKGWGLQFWEKRMSEQHGTFGEILQQALIGGSAEGTILKPTRIEKAPPAPCKQAAQDQPIVRTVLWDAGTVWVYVPMGARLNFKNDKLPADRRYLYYPVGVKGGFIPAHVYADGGLTKLVPLAGKIIAAGCRLMKKVVDGRTIIYLDLKKVDGDPTHILTVYTKASSVPKDVPRGFRVRVPGTDGMVHLYKM